MARGLWEKISERSAVLSPHSGGGSRGLPTTVYVARCKVSRNLVAQLGSTPHYYYSKVASSKLLGNPQ